MRRQTQVLFCVCLVLGGCGRYFAPDRNVKRLLSEADVVGTWKLTPSSLALLKRDGFKPGPSDTYTVAFSSDGTVAFASVLEGIEGYRYATISGTWKLEHDTRGDSNVYKKNAIHVELKAAGMTVFKYFNFAEDKGSLCLWNYHGDPDSWEFIEYTRLAAPAVPD